MADAYVIRLKDGSFWKSLNWTTTDMEGAAKFASRWTALSVMSRMGPVMHEAVIIPYTRPGGRTPPPEKSD